MSELSKFTFDNFYELLIYFILRE